ncbi:hypothetical protein HOM13_01240 [Candidatus Woesearchaeota archaeon]|nr:hypothetical protein [Candidatus Woesearchaeota archaeon]MBT5215339.1 hypothetical protein [Candidatus Woesearchaeota archaeon]MBT6402770.1 hypothetical protein [Candidatus Woesearchaeota archaeon]
MVYNISIQSESELSENWNFDKRKFLSNELIRKRIKDKAVIIAIDKDKVIDCS